MSKRVSILINCDTRPVCPEFQGMWKGVRSRDFISAANLINKRRFFEGYETELIVFVDEHEPLTTQQYEVLHEHADCVVVRKHSKYYRGNDPFNAFNDCNYLQAMAMSRCDYVAHFDQDVAAFKGSKDVLDWMFQQIDSEAYKFVCYPSPHSPHPCVAPNYEGKFWASTRFFLTKRDSIKLDVLERAIRQNDWFYSEYGKPPVVNPWTEAFLSQMNDWSVIYPPVVLHQWAVFPWTRYKDGTLEKMNGLSYPQIHAALERAGGSGIFWDGCSSDLLGI